jgi:hypothetical protein
MDNEYFIPLKPDYPLSFTMNFPQFEELNTSNSCVRPVMTLKQQIVPMNSNFNESSEKDSKQNRYKVWILSGRYMIIIFSGLIFVRLSKDFERFV